jgi:PBP1b-binding outer membrane lipoprotein LpoB
MISKKLAIASVALISAGLLSGCTAAGKDAPTSKIRQVTDGVEKDSGALKLRDFVLVAQPDGSAVLVGTVVNEDSSADAITSISANGIAGVVTGSGALAQNAPVIFSGDSANAHASFPGLNLTPGSRSDVTVTFGKAESVTLSVLVREKTDIFADVA